MTNLYQKKRNDNSNVRPENYKAYKFYKEHVISEYMIFGFMLNCLENGKPTLPANDKTKIDYTKLSNEDLLQEFKNHKHGIDWLDDYCFPRKTTQELLEDLYRIEKELYDFEEYVSKVNVIIDNLRYQCYNTNVRFTVMPHEDNFTEVVKTRFEIIIPQGNNSPLKLSFNI